MILNFYGSVASLDLGSGFGWDYRDSFNIEGNVYLVADHYATGFEGDVPAQTEILAVDAGLGSETGTGIAKRTLGLTGVLYFLPLSGQNKGQPSCPETTQSLPKGRSLCRGLTPVKAEIQTEQHSAPDLL